MNTKERNGALVGGFVLVLIGLLALAFQFLDAFDASFLGALIPLGLGLLFLVAGIVSREVGWLIPGGILTGIGTGIAFVAGPLDGLFPAADDGGLFLLAFAGGWFLITILSAIVTDETHWWPLIPGGIIGFIGLAVLFGGAFETVLTWLGYLWPVALIIGGLALLVQHFRSQSERPDEKQPTEKRA